MRERFELVEVENVITEESAREGDYASSEATEPVMIDLRTAVDAMLNGCWDNVDARGDGTIILYPADYSQNMRMGDWEGTELILRADSPMNGERLYACWGRGT